MLRISASLVCFCLYHLSQTYHILYPLLVIEESMIGLTPMVCFCLPLETYHTLLSSITIKHCAHRVYLTSGNSWLSDTEREFRCPIVWIGYSIGFLISNVIDINIQDVLMVFYDWYSKSCIRLFPVSATYTAPLSLSTPTPSGSINCPSPEPGSPNFVMNCPSLVNT